MTQSVDNNQYYTLKGNNIGWTCPNCGKVFSPMISECLYCNSKTSVISDNLKEIPFDLTTSNINIKEYVKEDTIARYENK